MPSSSTLPSRGARTRERILQAASDLFLEQGYHGTSMRQVAELAGVTPSSIYNHVANKESLFTELLGERLPHRALADALAQVNAPDSEALIKAGFRTMREAMADQYDNLRLVLIELLEFQGRHLQDFAEHVLPGMLAFITRIRQADGSVREASDLMLLRTIFGLFMSYAISMSFAQSLFANDPGVDDLEEMADLLIHGLCGPGSSAAGTADSQPQAGAT